MNVTGLCSICRTAGVMYSCTLCGRTVCGNCLTVKGVCKSCLTGRKMDTVGKEDLQTLARKMLEHSLGK